ncbi:tyrosine-type recombinase/integrase [Salarchaeum japonicum]|uniref:tyrosine-type recombinase/integrase n=1 Tax=Salarchaeum japonicum TaxID=555573 RepID=UPI003C76278D
MTAQHTLEPLAPERAKTMYKHEREGEVSERTLQAHHYRLVHFIRWCETEGIDNMNDLTGRKLHEFRLWRKEDGDLNAVSLRTQLETLRVFIKFCETIDAVPQDLHEKILLPTLSNDDEQREEILRTEQAEAVLEYLRRFEYASRTHVILELLWHTGIRLGSLRGIDLDDIDQEKERLRVRHRPDTETSLKNGSEGERLIALRRDVCEMLEDWIDHQRPPENDEQGREPLLTTTQGRIAGTTIRETVYKATRPCYYGDECPHDRDPDDCEGTTYGYHSRCPSSVSPHSVRRGSITHHLTEDVPEQVVSDRMNVGQDVLDKHYDKRSEEVKVEQRRGYVDQI